MRSKEPRLLIALASLRLRRRGGAGELGHVRTLSTLFPSFPLLSCRSSSQFRLSHIFPFSMFNDELFLSFLPQMAGSFKQSKRLPLFSQGWVGNDFCFSIHESLDRWI